MMYASLAPVLHEWSLKIAESLPNGARAIDASGQAGNQAAELILRLIDEPNFDPAPASADAKAIAVVFLDLVRQIFAATPVRLPAHLADLSACDAARILLRAKICKALAVDGMAQHMC